MSKLGISRQYALDNGITNTITDLWTDERMDQIDSNIIFLTLIDWETPLKLGLSEKKSICNSIFFLSR